MLQEHRSNILSPLYRGSVNYEEILFPIRISISFKLFDLFYSLPGLIHFQDKAILLGVIQIEHFDRKYHLLQPVDVDG